MKILIDACNLSEGGGLTHLREFTRAFSNNPTKDYMLSVIGNSKALGVVAESDKINKIFHESLDKNLVFRTFFRLFKIKKYFNGHDMLLDIGGGYISGRTPYITMSRNMLVFENEEAKRFGLSWIRLKLVILRIVQTISMKKAIGVIFISNYAYNYITGKKGIKIKNSVIVNHGSTDFFRHQPREQFPIEEYNNTKPFKLLYISTLAEYKHQLETIQAICKLRQKYPVSLTLVGGKIGDYFNRLNSEININEARTFINFIDKVDWAELNRMYLESNMFLFGSSCENMPNILIEAMSSGLPIACSDRGPMPEFLKDAGVYFDPCSVNSILQAVQCLISDPGLRQELASKSFEYSSSYSWEHCVRSTLEFVELCAKDKGLFNKFNINCEE